MTAAPPNPQTPAPAARLVQVAEQRRDSAAVRYKERGVWRVMTFRQLDQRIAESAIQAVSVAGTAPGFEATRLCADWLVRTLDELGALAPPRVLHGTGRDQERELLWLEPVLDDLTVRGRLVQYWLDDGGVLGVGETIDTVDIDRRELGPTLLLARASWYDALTAQVVERIARGSRPRRALLHWALRTAPDTTRAGAARRTLARLLVLRPLSDQLGLSRVRQALSVGDVGQPTRSLFAALSGPLRSLGEEDERADTKPWPEVAEADGDGVFVVAQGGVQA